MNSQFILTRGLILSALLFSFCTARAQSNPTRDAQVATDTTHENKRSQFTLDPMSGSDSDVPGGDQLSDDEADVISPDEGHESTQYTLSVAEKTETIERYNPNDDIRTLAGNTQHQGGYGGLSFKWSQFNDKYLALAGFRAGWIVNRTVGIGFEGYGVIPSTEYSGIDPIYNTRVVGGYGGLTVEPILFSNTVVHVTFPVSGGAGWLGYLYDWEEDFDNDDDDLIDGDVFWYVEPGVALEINVTKFFRVNTGATHRFTQDFQLVNTESDAFNGWSYFVTFKFGRF